jgi:hypothetical protein
LILKLSTAPAALTIPTPAPLISSAAGPGRPNLPPSAPTCLQH